MNRYIQRDIILLQKYAALACNTWLKITSTKLDPTSPVGFSYTSTNIKPLLQCNMTAFVAGAQSEGLFKQLDADKIK